MVEKEIDEFEHQLIVAEDTTVSGREFEEGHVVFGGEFHPNDGPTEPPLVESNDLLVDYVQYVDGEYVEREPYNYGETRRKTP